jgi:Domain of unknown function (DUF4396)
VADHRVVLRSVSAVGVVAVCEADQPTLARRARPERTAEFVIFALAIQLLGSMLLAEYVGDYAAALALGILFQYWALAPMRGLNFRDGIRAAAKADVLSLTAFEVGLFGWMAIMVFVLFPSSPLHPISPVYMVPHADRHDPGLRHIVAGQCVADPQRDKGIHVGSRNGLVRPDLGAVSRRGRNVG